MQRLWTLLPKNIRPPCQRYNKNRRRIKIYAEMWRGICARFLSGEAFFRTDGRQQRDKREDYGINFRKIFLIWKKSIVIWENKVYNTKVTELHFEYYRQEAQGGVK